MNAVAKLLGLLVVGVLAPTGSHAASVYTKVQAISPTTVSVGWTPFGSSVTAYKIYRDGALLSTTSSLSNLSYVDLTVKPAMQYTYSVHAVNADNSMVDGGSATVRTFELPVRYKTTFEEDATLPTALVGGWTKIAGNTNCVTVTSERSRAGGQSVKFDFNFSDWQKVDLGVRCQLTQRSSNLITPATLGQDFWLGVSTYIDDSWQPDDSNNGELIWQFHGNTGGPAQSGPPPMALYIHGSSVQVIVNGDPLTVYPSGGRSGPVGRAIATFDLSELKGKWTDWVIQVNFEFVNGRTVVWKNGAKVADDSGPNIYHWIGERISIGPFWNFGVYKWNWGSFPTLVSNRTVYFDEIRIGTANASCADVKPTGSAPCQ